ncbi:hypothetical protein D7B24_005452 [Verticillium nonalfalfae]|uniref:ABM domain-containing protein n=1 Tax=Verticillium nonalfalfae TaxID=1051616 RepID=A0A3M9YBR8_9PEZI|nr:uncharacterized protein D7B24_005452 [Verticillium nonalfalfae]RNJ57967.1 hypothetical protein D7B24_005452 [Verticillium nonalfalfae]
MKIYKSSDINIPRDLNLTELLHTTAFPIPESHLIASDSLTNRSTTLGELRDRAGRLAKGLYDQLNPPDQARWAIVLPNSVDFLEIFHAILWTGGVVCPVNHALRYSEIGPGLAVARPHFVVAYGPVVHVVEQALDFAAEMLVKEKGSWTRPRVISIVLPAPGLKHISSDFIAATRLPVPHFDDTSIRLASIHLSSGTTGQPKGVELTHQNFVANVLQLLAFDAPGGHKMFHPAARTVAFTPWAHIANTTAPLFLGPYAGMLHHAMPVYNLEQFARLVGSVQATSFQGVPSVVLALGDSDVTAKYDFSAARVIAVGGVPLKKAQLEKLLARAPWRLCQAYGMTEAAGYVAYQEYDEVLYDGCTGKLLPGIEACLKQEGGVEDVPDGETGELWLRGPNISRGYAFDAEANERAFPMPGWYNTGDVCRIDEQGRVSIVGRTKDLIKYKGFQVSPAELEVKRKFVIAIVPTASVAKRDEFINELAKSAHEAQVNEDGTLKYAVLTSRDIARETDIWVVEEYVNEAAFDHHMSLPSVNAMRAWMGENVGPKPPTMHILTYPSDSFQFSRQQVNEHTDPWIIIAELNYMVGGVGL